MLPLDMHIEGRHLEILPEWREKIEAELARLQHHYSGPILRARTEDYRHRPPPSRRL